MTLSQTKGFKEYINVQNSPSINPSRLYYFQFIKNFTSGFKKGNKFKRVCKVFKKIKARKSSEFKTSCIQFVFKSLRRLRPLVFFRAKKVAGVLHRIPVIHFGHKRERFQSVWWLFFGAKVAKKKKKIQNFNSKLTNELFSVFFNKSNSSALYHYRQYHKLVTASLPLTRFLKKKKK